MCRSQSHPRVNSEERTEADIQTDSEFFRWADESQGKDVSRGFEMFETSNEVKLVGRGDSGGGDAAPARGDLTDPFNDHLHTLFERTPSAPLALQHLSSPLQSQQLPI